MVVVNCFLIIALITVLPLVSAIQFTDQHRDEIHSKISSLVNTTICNPDRIDLFTQCLDELDSEIVQFGNLGLHFEVHCCIYAKFRYCLHRDYTYCGRSVRNIVHNVMLLEQNLHESDRDEHHCLQRQYPSVECALFYHQSAAIVVGAAILFVTGLLLASCIISFCKYQQADEADDDLGYFDHNANRVCP